MNVSLVNYYDWEVGVQGKFAARVISDYSAVLPKNEGCEWRVMTVNGNVVLRVPFNYTGGAKCRYVPGVPGIISGRAIT